MARALRIRFPGAFYHVTSRGNDRQPVFKSSRDREKFLSYLESATERYGAVVHVYCLLDNHYHLFLETPSGKPVKGNANISMGHIRHTSTSNVKDRDIFSRDGTRPYWWRLTSMLKSCLVTST
jgi:putative transposase